MRASLHGANHDPTAGRRWAYTVLATDAKGRGLPGTADTAFAFSGKVVGHETPPVHRLKAGHLTDRITFPAAAVGVPLTVQVVVHTSLGSATLNWSVKVHK